MMVGFNYHRGSPCELPLSLMIQYKFQSGQPGQLEKLRFPVFIMQSALVKWDIWIFLTIYAISLDIRSISGRSGEDKECYYLLLWSAE